MDTLARMTNSFSRDARDRTLIYKSVSEDIARTAALVWPYGSSSVSVDTNGESHHSLDQSSERRSTNVSFREIVPRAPWSEQGGAKRIQLRSKMRHIASGNIRLRRVDRTVIRSRWIHVLRNTCTCRYHLTTTEALPQTRRSRKS
jgi:hypothetical protein